MSTLMGGSKATKAEIADLELELFNANGQFVGMQSVISKLAPKLAGMTQQQQAVAEKALFGATAGRELNTTLSPDRPPTTSLPRPHSSTAPRPAQPTRRPPR